MTYIKPDLEMQEEQEDLIMSYLNADYLSTDSTPLSPPSSTSSSSDTTGSPEKHSVDDFMLDINTADFLNNDIWATSTDNLFNPCFPQQQPGADLLATFPFFLPQTTNTSVTTPINFIQPFPIMPNTTTTTAATINIASNNSSTSSSASTCSLSDSEQPKKKRGRKKREPVAQNLSPVQPSLLAPKPLAPRPNLDASSTTVFKTEPNTTMTIESQQQQQQQNLAGPTKCEISSSSSSSSSSSANNDQPQSQEAQKAAQIQKRQERLIKNRAAALLSRKRKREHLTCLEEEKQILVQENEKLTNKVATLENRIQTLEKENLDLKQHLQLTTNLTSSASSTVINIGHNKRPLMSNNTPKASKATGVVFMIILFSFALFTLPSRTADRLTVGGGSVMDAKKQFPLIGSSHHDMVDYSVEQYCQTNNCDDNNEPDVVINTNTDLVLIDAVRPRDLQTWINHKLDTSSSSSSSSGSDIQTWSAGASNSGEQQQQQQQQQPGHVYLYSKEFSQIAPMNPSSNYQFGTTNDLPILSLISPYNQTDMNDDEDHLQDDCDKSYLQIDVQVLRSTVIKSQLLPLQQCDSASALLDGMKKDLITNQHYLLQQQRANVTPSIIVKREKRANKKLARVIT